MTFALEVVLFPGALQLWPDIDLLQPPTSKFHYFMTLYILSPRSGKYFEHSNQVISYVSNASLLFCTE